MQKNHNTRIILITLIILGIIAFGFYYFVLRDKGGVTPVTPDPTRPAQPNRPNPNFPVATSTNTGATTTPIVDTQGNPLPLLRKISQGSVAGYVTFEKSFLDAKKKRQQETIIRYAEKVKSPIYETKTNTLDTQRLASAQIPLVEEVVWNPKGDSLYMRYADEDNEDIITYFGKLLPIKNASSSFIAEGVTFDTQEIKGSFLSKGIQQLLVLGEKSNLFYLTKISEKGAGISAGPDGVKKTQIFSSPLTEWTSSWPKEGTIAIANKPTYLSPSSLYFLNTSTNAIEKILGGYNGLTTLVSPDIKSVLFTKNDENTTNTNIYNLAKGSVVSFPLTTFPEKCAWSKKDVSILFCAVPRILPTQQYPDDWYQGVVSFSDALYRVNTKNNSVTLIADPLVLVQESIDVVNPSLTEKEDFILFQNKKDGILWSLSLN